MDHVKRAHRITKEVDVQFDNFYLIGGYRFPAELAVQAETTLSFKYLGKIAADETLDEYVLEGKSLLELPSDNAACVSVKKIMKTAGYL
jgi:CO dehydrogenase nickel-insertion accessory protein CooC1